MRKEPPLFLGRDYFQNAWVVDDLQAAMRRWTETCGVGPFFLLEHVAMQDVTYRGQPATIDCSIALAQAGRTQIELIEQHCDQPSVYRDLVPRGQTRFHHVATFANDYDRELALVVEHDDAKTGGREIVGVGRLSKLPGVNEAEFAVLVNDLWQGRGLGPRLLALLIQVARDERLSCLRADILPGGKFNCPCTSRSVHP